MPTQAQRKSQFPLGISPSRSCQGLGNLEEKERRNSFLGALGECSVPRQEKEGTSPPSPLPHKCIYRLLGWLGAKCEPNTAPPPYLTGHPGILAASAMVLFIAPPWCCGQDDAQGRTHALLCTPCSLAEGLIWLPPLNFSRVRVCQNPPKIKGALNSWAKRLGFQNLSVPSPVTWILNSQLMRPWEGTGGREVQSGPRQGHLFRPQDHLVEG